MVSLIVTVPIVLLVCQLIALGESQAQLEGSSHELTITRSESFNHHGSYVAANAHDGDYNTQYSVKDRAVAGNFLKLYLSQQYNIGEVKMTSRKGEVMSRRMLNTEVLVYSTDTIDVLVATCGTITEFKTGDYEDVDDLTYTLDCDGALGDMLYLTDLDYNADAGHNIAEVKTYGSDWIAVKPIVGRKLHIDLVTTALEIRTDVGLNSNTNIYVLFFDGDDREAGGINIEIINTVKYKLGHCMTGFKHFTIPVEVTGDDVWKISKQGINLNVLCNGKEILQLTLSDTVCDNTNLAWTDYWTKDIAKVQFGAIGNIASKFYSPPRHCTGVNPRLKSSTEFPILQGEVATVSCAAGFILSGNSVITCSHHNIFTEDDVVISPSCNPCEAGKYGPEGALTCEVCPLNKFSSQAGSAQCSDCPLGKVSNTGSTYCDVCPPGTYRNEGMETCDPCIDGTVSAAGFTNCAACQEGSQANTAKTRCVNFCEDPDIENSRTYERVTEGAEIKIQCARHFAVIGQQIITCQANGEFSDSPTCKKISKISAINTVGILVLKVILMGMNIEHVLQLI